MRAVATVMTLLFGGFASKTEAQPYRALLRKSKRSIGYALPRAQPPSRPPLRGSTTGEPIMALLDLLGRRWTLRVIWELRDGPLTFRDLQERCAGMSSSVLNERLRDLRAAGIAAAADSGYELTAEGLDLLEAYKPLNAWARRWARRVQHDTAQ